MKHAWSEPEVIDPNNTIRRCAKCPTLRVTRHEPGHFPPHWTMWDRGDGKQFHSDKVPPCTSKPKDVAMTTAVAEKPDAKSPPKILNALEGATAKTVFKAGGVEAMLAKIAKEARPAHIDLSTKTGREAVASAAYKVSRASTILDDIGKDHVAVLKKQTSAIDAMRRTLREGLATLKDEIRAPLTEYEETEAARVQAHDDALLAVTQLLAHAGERSSVEIDFALTELGEIAQRDWQEYETRAVSTIDHVRAGLRQELQQAKQREAERAELEELRAKNAEREALERDERIAREAAEEARQQAANEVAEANARAAVAEQARIDAAAQAERDRLQAIEDERARVAADERRKENEARARENNKRHCAKINNEVKAALIKIGASETIAKEIIVAIIRGTVPHTSITY